MPLSANKFDHAAAQNLDYPEASHRFHLVINVSEKEARTAFIGTALAVASASVFVVGSRMKIGPSVVESALLILEDSAQELWAHATKLVKVNQTLNYFELKNGVECSLSKDISFLHKENDLISMVDPLGNEVHLLRNGSRTVVRSGVHYFYDQAGIGLHMPTRNPLLPNVVFENKAYTPLNKKLFKTIENSFWTGYTGALNRIPDIVGKASRF